MKNLNLTIGELNTKERSDIVKDCNFLCQNHSFCSGFCTDICAGCGSSFYRNCGFCIVSDCSSRKCDCILDDEDESSDL